MDKKFRIKTFIRKNHRFGGNDFIRGRISGIGHIMCGKDGYATVETEDGYIYENDFTSNKYDDFINIIEKLYPGLCKFAYDSEKESK